MVTLVKSSTVRKYCTVMAVVWMWLCTFVHANGCGGWWVVVSRCCWRANFEAMRCVHGIRNTQNRDFSLEWESQWRSSSFLSHTAMTTYRSQSDLTIQQAPPALHPIAKMVEFLSCYGLAFYGWPSLNAQKTEIKAFK